MQAPHQTVLVWFRNQRELRVQQRVLVLPALQMKPVVFPVPTNLLLCHIRPIPTSLQALPPGLQSVLYEVS